MKPVSAILLALIQIYRWTLSSLIGHGCRYAPSCSHFAQEAIRAHGPWAGGWMALARLSRCHPWGGSGYDPVTPSAALAPWWAPWRYGIWQARKIPQNPSTNAEQ